MMLPLATAAVLIALPIGDTPEGGFSPYLTSPPAIGGGPPSPTEIEDCVYDRALEYFDNDKPQTEENDTQVQRIIVDECIKHDLPLAGDERDIVARGLQRAFIQALKDVRQGK